jgi:hypothetical protein
MNHINMIINMMSFEPLQSGANTGNENWSKQALERQARQRAKQGMGR